MKLEKALDIISRIDAITEDTSEDEIFNIIDDAYYLLAVECKAKLDAMKEHIDDIVVSYDDSEPAVPTPAPKKSARQSAPSTEPVYEEDAEMADDIPARKKPEPASAPKRAPAKKTASAPKRQAVDNDYSSLFD